MRRVVVIVVVYLLLVGGAAVVAYRMGGDDARKAGLALYPHRWFIDRLRSGLSKPDVVWVGDSTLLDDSRAPSYVGLIQKRVLGPDRRTSAMIAEPGLDFYPYWSIAGRVAALHPKVVVVIANLRTFAPAGGVRSFGDLTAEIDAVDLPETLALPFYVRGMTFPRVLLARALRTEIGESIFLSFEGLRRNAEDAAAWKMLGPAKRPPAANENLFRFFTVGNAVLASYDRPLTPDNALLDFTGATVARLVRGGATVLVVVTPMPWERAMRAGYYEQGRFERRIAILRDVVEAGGGRLIDLHRALKEQDFRDGDCHFSAQGADEMTRLLAPEVMASLRARGAVAIRVP